MELRFKNNKTGQIGLAFVSEEDKKALSLLGYEYSVGDDVNDDERDGAIVKFFNVKQDNGVIEPTTYDEFEEVISDAGWDEAIRLIDDNPANSDNLLALATVYWNGYQTEDYHKTLDPDVGMCYNIRKFAIQQIMKVLKEQEG